MSRFTRIVTAVILFVIVVAAAFAGFQATDASQDEAAAEPRTVENETLVQKVDMWQLVEKSTDEYTTGFGENVTVYNETGTELQEGTDYKWNETDGAIRFEDTNSTQDGNQANITYSYDQNTQAVQDADGPLDAVVTGFGLLPIMAAGVGLMVFLIVMAQVVMDSAPKGRR